MRFSGLLSCLLAIIFIFPHPAFSQAKKSKQKDEVWGYLGFGGRHCEIGKEKTLGGFEVIVGFPLGHGLNLGGNAGFYRGDGNGNIWGYPQDNLFIESFNLGCNAGLKLIQSKHADISFQYGFGPQLALLGLKGKHFVDWFQATHLCLNTRPMLVYRYLGNWSFMFNISYNKNYGSRKYEDSYNTLAWYQDFDGWQFSLMLFPLN